MRLSLSFTVFLQFFLFLQSCNKPPQGSQLEYHEFHLKFDLFPFRKEYVAGDTIWLEVDIPDKMLEDIETNEMIRVGNARFFCEIKAGDLEAFSDPDDWLETIILDGDILETPPNVFIKVLPMQFGCPESFYHLKTGLIFLKSGEYFIQIAQTIGLVNISFTEDDDCSITSQAEIPPLLKIGGVSYFFNLVDTNLDLFLASPSSQNLWDEPGIEEMLQEKTGFFVKVLN